MDYSELMNATVRYVEDFIPSRESNPNALADLLFDKLMELPWVQRDNTPRAEYYCNDTNAPYTYGVRQGERTYWPQPWTPEISIIREWVEFDVGAVMDVCFLNRYDTSRHGLGWHSDDSPEMDPERPIVTVSLGQARDIQFRPIEFPKEVESLTLGHGSMAVMEPGMQQSWQHRIPKCGFVAKPRISLTFRGYIS